MPIIEVKSTIAGATLAEDVHTMLGGILFVKGTTLYEKEVEVLQAFMVDRVVIEDTDEPKTSAADENRSDSATSKVVTGGTKEKE